MAAPPSWDETPLFLQTPAHREMQFFYCGLQVQIALSGQIESDILATASKHERQESHRDPAGTRFELIHMGCE